MFFHSLRIFSLFTIVFNNIHNIVFNILSVQIRSRPENKNYNDLSAIGARSCIHQHRKEVVAKIPKWKFRQ